MRLFICLFLVSSSINAAEIIDLGTLGGPYWNAAWGVNDSDQVSAVLSDSNGASRTYIYEDHRIHDLYPLSGGLGFPSRINSFGQIASGAINKQGKRFPAIYAHGVVSIIGSLGGTDSQGNAGFSTDVNDLSQVVGYAFTPNGEWHPFLYSRGQMMDLGCLPGENPCLGFASAINNAGAVVGGTLNNAFLYSGGVMTRLNPDACGIGRALDINEKGQIVGLVICGNAAPKAFVYEGGTMTILPVNIGGPYAAATAINNAGTIVGFMEVGPPSGCLACGFENHGFMYSSGKLTDLNSLVPNSGWTLQRALGLNNNGSIVGDGLLNGELHAFLLTGAY